LRNQIAKDEEEQPDSTQSEGPSELFGK